MQHIVGGYRGLSLIVELYGDRMLTAVAIGAALFGAAYLGTV